MQPRRPLAELTEVMPALKRHAHGTAVKLGNAMPMEQL